MILSQLSSWIPSSQLTSVIVNFILEKLDIGAFRVHTNKKFEEALTKKQDIPRRKAVDFGYHCHRYYQLPIELVADKSSKSFANLEKIQWNSELANSSFFNQLQYLTDAVNEEKEDINEYFSLQNEKVSFEELEAKKKSTIKKVSYYAQERNLSLIDTGIKTLLF